jgi:hypothetical protein
MVKPDNHSKVKGQANQETAYTTNSNADGDRRRVGQQQTKTANKPRGPKQSR